MTVRAAPGLLFALFALLPQLGNAQGGLLDYQLKAAAEQGKGYPEIHLNASSDFQRVDLVCQRSDGEEIKLPAGAMRSGSKQVFALKQPAGVFSWDCEAKGWYGKGEDEYFDLPMRFQTFLGAALAIEVPRDKIDLDGELLVVKADRVITSARVTVYTPEGTVFDGAVEVDENSPGDEVQLAWDGGGEILRLDVNITDRWGFYSYEELYPWSLEIPHDDVHFDTGSHVITDAEMPKIVKASKAIRDVVERYGKFVEVRLYVAGYTDTVGDRASNAALSERRARSIAQALRAQGFGGKVYYQGFGEDAQAVETADSVDEILNRRALYLLGSRTPPPSGALPRSSWKPL